MCDNVYIYMFIEMPYRTKFITLSGERIPYSNDIIIVCYLLFLNLKLK